MDRPDGLAVDGGPRAGRGWLPVLSLVAALLAWLWPIGLGGAMPVGGDVTRFSIGLMAVLGRALRSGRLPLWNDLWGFGFPGLAESQMGVFYPPHLLLYGLLPTETAYTVSLVVHTLWAGLGARWLARRLGVSNWGATLSGFAWATSGFYLIHLPHQWGYTVGSWMPWAWGLGWMVLRGGGVRTVGLLAAVLAIQVLPGHFQLAFNTQVGLLALGTWTFVDPPEGDRRRAIFRVAALLGSIAAVLPLAAAQLWPTYLLARLAVADRDFEYLSGFASTPIHLVSYVAPGLFHRSSLWRPLIWDPFHTSPEENLAYLGLVPLFLAIVAAARGVRREPTTRALLFLGLLALVFSLGPYLPGFRIWCRWPGFSFFRAPARWSLASGLALAILAGRGFDEFRDLPRPGRSLARFAALAIAAPVAILIAIELAFASTDGPGWPTIAGGFDRAFRALPWSGDPPFRELVATARRPLSLEDRRVAVGLARLLIDPGPPESRTFRHERARIYAIEWSETGLLIVALLAIAPWLDRSRSGPTALLVLTAVDLLTLGRHRPIDLAPIGSLEARSPVLAALADRPRGSRSIDSLGNLPMLAGSAPVSAYRTLDLPALESLTALAHAPISIEGGDPAIVAALRALGAGVRIFDGLERPSVDLGPTAIVLGDPALAGWLDGPAWVATPSGSRASRFTLWSPIAEPSRAWLIPDSTGRTLADLAADSGHPATILGALEAAKPLSTRSDVPERLEVDVEAPGPGVVLISQLDVPDWEARWSEPDGSDRPATIVRVFGGWQAVATTEPGPRTLRLTYRARDVRLGLIVSGLAWPIGFLACWIFGRRTSRTRVGVEVESTAVGKGSEAR